MSVYKDGKNNTWRVIYRYTDWTGERKQTQRRGFLTKREAQAWEHEQLSKLGSDLDMTFKSFVERYTEDMQPKLNMERGNLECPQRTGTSTTAGVM